MRSRPLVLPRGFTISTKRAPPPPTNFSPDDERSDDEGDSPAPDPLPPRDGTAAKQSPGVIRWADEDQMERELSAATLEPARGMVTLRSGSSKKKLWGKVRDHFHLRNKAVATARPGADAATRARSSSYHSPKSAEDRDLILRGLRTCPLFDDVSESVAAQLEDAMREVSFEPGEAIVTQGARDDDAFYVLASGTANVVVDGSTVKTLVPSDPFGEVSLMYNTERTATVRAAGTSKCRAFELKRERYDLVRAAQADADARRRLELVSASPTLRALDTTTLRRVAESAEPTRFRAGETIFVRGDVGDALYVVEVGIVSVHAAGGEEVRRFGVKDVFGEVALLNDDGRRTADAIAATDCVLLAITRDAFTAIAGPSIKAALHGADIANVPLFAHLDVKQIAALAEATRLVKFSDGDEVIRAGMPPECLFIVDEGTFEEFGAGVGVGERRALAAHGSLLRGGDEMARAAGKKKWTRGEYFGESSLLTNEPRGLGVRAVGLASAVTLSRDAIARTVGSLGEVQRAWKRTAVEKCLADNGTDPSSAEGENATAALADELEIRCCKAGEVLADGDEAPAGVFVGVLVSGTVVSVTRVRKGDKNLTRRQVAKSGGVYLPSKAAVARTLLGEEWAEPGWAIDAKVAALTQSVLLVPPAAASGRLRRAISTLSGDETETPAAPDSARSDGYNGYNGHNGRGLPNGAGASHSKTSPARVRPKDRVVPPSLKLIATLGSGGFSRVFHVTARVLIGTNGAKVRRSYALKVVPIEQMVKNNVVHNVRNERDVMMALDHPFITRLHACFKAADHVYYVLDLIPGLELYWCMQNFEFSERGAAFYVAQVVLMLEYMHERQVAYRDVKPENLMLANDGYLRLVDFGLSKFLAPGERTFTFCGTPLYLAPEIWGHGGHDKAVDWWALGCLAYELASNGTLPFHGETQGDIRKKILNEPVSFDGAAKRFSPELRALVEGLLQKNQHKRLGVLRDGAGGVKTSAWFRDLDWIALARMEYPPPFTPDAAGGSKEALRITPRDQELVPPPSRECPMYGDMFPDF